MPDVAPLAPIPRGRHAPPREVRVRRQRDRLFAAAAEVFARSGYADAGAEAISRQAGMSKATFYEHFANKEECILALFDESARGAARETRAVAAREFPSYEERVTAGAGAFVARLDAQPALARTVIVEIIGAGPRAMARRDEVLQQYADWLYADNARSAPAYGAGTFASPDDAFAVIGAILELVSRRLRSGRPERPEELVAVITRLLLGVLRPA